MIYSLILLNYVKYGHLGLFIYTLVETLAPLPPIEILQIPMTFMHPEDWYLFVINICLSSIIGIIVGYNLGRKYGNKILLKFGVKQTVIDKASNWLNKYDVLAVSIFAFTPFPFTIGIIVAGIMKINQLKFYLTCIIARCIRFIMVGYFCYIMSDKVDVETFSTSKITLFLFILGASLVLLYYGILAIKKKVVRP